VPIFASNSSASTNGASVSLALPAMSALRPSSPRQKFGPILV
jgi:hypothetical protein